MFTKLDANNCCSIIAQVLSNSAVNSANKESIAHILLQLWSFVSWLARRFCRFIQLNQQIINISLLKKVLPYSEAFLCSSQFNFLLPRLSLPWKHNQNARQPVPAIIISCEAIKARYDNNSYQTFPAASCETIDSCPHMSAFGFGRLFLRTFTFWMNTIHNDCLPLFRRHTISSAMNVGFTSFFIVNFSHLLKVLQSHLRERRNIYRKKKTTWADMERFRQSDST